MHGPVATSQLKKLAASGKLKPDDQLAQSKEGPFRAAAKAKGLFPAKKKAKPAEDEFVEAVVIEDDYESFDDAVDYDDYGDVDEYGAVADYEDYDDYEDVEEPAPRSRSRRSSSSSSPPKARPAKSTKSKPKKSKSKAKKKSSDDDEEEDGPWWLNVLWGVGCIGLGFMLFFMARSAEASGEEIDFGRKGGLFKLLYNILGAWGVLGVLCLAGCAFLYAAYDSYQEQ